MLDLYDDEDEPLEPFSPHGEGYMPLTCAAQWDATKGLRIPFDRVDRAMRRQSYRRILDLLASGKIEAVGDGPSEGDGNSVISREEFADCAIHLPELDEIDIWHFMNRQVLCSYAYESLDAWRDLFDDQLLRGDIILWRRIKVLKADVLAHLPVQARMKRSGTVGRPSSLANLVLPELRRRAAANELEKTLAGEARALSAWLAKDHPDEPQISPRPCEIGIREVYWAARNGSKSST